VELDTGSRLTASTASGEGGNIALRVQGVLQLRRNSLISAEAGGTGNGGNIDITAGFIVANPVENSDIIANAVGGRGGRITLTAQGILGLQFRPTLTPLSDITASSGIGLDGIVTLNVPNTDPNPGATSLPSGIVDTAKLIATSCVARRIQPSQGSFTITGTGDVATQSDDLASAPFATYELLPLPVVAQGEHPVPPVSPTPNSEIDGIYRLENGAIVLGRRCL
jgi:large exoprotein involved in heme utilization and adhesion